jgi:hypothetical protein
LVLNVDPDAGELAIVAIEARLSSANAEVVSLGLLDRPGGIPEMILYGSPDALRALAEAIGGSLGLLEIAPEGSVDYVARIGEPRQG